MPVSATASKYFQGQRLVSENLTELSGGTPLIQLRRSGDGQVWVKHEGLQPSGSYFDRIAAKQLDALASGTPGIILDGSTSHTVSALTLAASKDLSAVVLLAPDAPKRLFQLISRFCPDIRRYNNDQERKEIIASLQQQRYVLLKRNEESAHLQALTDLALEGLEASERPLASWVLVDYGIAHTRVVQTMRRVLGHPIHVHFIADDKEVQRTLNGAAASRRAQVGHREGLLVGPTAAEVIDRAVDVALSSGERVCAVIPDGGQRYLGWW